MAQEVDPSLTLGARRLNGWQRIGIVLSVVWAPIGGLANYNAYLTRASEMSSREYHTCDDANQAFSKFPEMKGFIVGDCGARAAQVYEDWSQGKLSGAALAALVPIPIAWLLAYALIGLVRWIRRGFSPS